MAGNFSNISGPSELLHDYWEAMGDTCQSVWEHQILPVIGEDESVHFIWGIGFWLNFVLHWVLVGLFLIVDLTGWPQFITKYKVQPGTNEKIEFKRVLKFAKIVMFNTTVVYFPFLMVGWAIRRSRPVPAVQTLPTLSTFLLHFAFNIVVDDLGYYVLHKYLLHNRKLYKHLHKQHHEMSAPIAITTLYCSPLEHLINVGTVSLGPLILNSHIFTLLLWVTYSTIMPIHNHVGYEVPYVFFLFPPASKHDFHHEKPTNQMWGKHGTWDYILGTDSLWRTSMAKKGQQARKIREIQSSSTIKNQ